MMKKMIVSFALTCAALLVANAAQAQDADGVHGTVIAGVGAAPTYEGADDYRYFPLLNGRITANQRYIEIEGLTARVNLIALDGVEFGPVANLTFGRDAKAKAAAVAALRPIDDAYEVGAFAALSTRLGASGRARLLLQAVHDVSGVHNGWVATARAGYDVALGKFAIGADVAASYASGDYMRTYFTVTPAGAAASGLATYSAGAGIKDIGVNAHASYRLSRRWSLNAVGGYKRLVGDAADSPVVTRAGNANQLFGGIGIGFSF